MRVLGILFAASLAVSAAEAMPAYPPGATALEARLLAKMGPQARAWIVSEARREVTIGYYSQETQAQAAVHYGAPSTNLTTLSFLVLMQAARDAEADVHAAVDSRNMASTQVAREEQLANGIDKYSVHSELSPSSDIAAQQGNGPTFLSTKLASQDPATAGTTHPDSGLPPPPPPKPADMQKVMDRESDIEDTLAKAAKVVTPAVEAATQSMG
jgi:hypothetical protein